jgi:hypothetical protein
VKTSYTIYQDNETVFIEEIFLQKRLKDINEKREEEEEDTHRPNGAPIGVKSI